MPLETEPYHLLGDPFTSRHTRPPWAIAEHAFVQICDRCGDCVDACPEQVLVYGRGDYPEIDFSRGGCTFCGKCVDACERGGLQAGAPHPWRSRAFIAATCRANRGTPCTRCGDTCPAGAIGFRPQVGHAAAVPILEEMLCTGCGACVSACPAAAISVYRMV